MKRQRGTPTSKNGSSTSKKSAQRPKEYTGREPQAFTTRDRISSAANIWPTPTEATIGSREWKELQKSLKNIVVRPGQAWLEPLKNLVLAPWDNQVNEMTLLQLVQLSPHLEILEVHRIT